MPDAVLECMRYDGSAQSTIRSADEDVEIAGVDVPCGTSVILMFGSGNRDPAQYTNPERLDIERNGVRLQTFAIRQFRRDFRGIRPGEDEVGSQIAGVHRDVGASVGLAQDHGELRDPRRGERPYQRRSVPDHAGPLLL